MFYTGYTGYYGMDQLTGGLAPDTAYYWTVSVLGPDGGSGLAYWAYAVGEGRPVNFA